MLHLDDTTGCQTGCTTGLTTGWMFVYTIQPAIDREFVATAKKFANFNEFSEIKKILKIRTKIR